MRVRFTCPCGQKLKTHADTPGRRARCPKCARWLRIPQSDSYDTRAEELPADESAGIPAPSALSPGGHPKPTLLVADSNAPDREHTVGVLRQHGYEVIQAGDGAAALDMIRHFHPLVAILNIHLNELSGFQVIQQLRNLSNPLNKEVFDTPVVMTTEKLHGRDKQYAIHLGVESFYQKPVDPVRICARLEKTIHNYHPHVE
jgi:CheY-like chemotaxis protein